VITELLLNLNNQESELNRLKAILQRVVTYENPSFIFRRANRVGQKGLFNCAGYETKRQNVFFSIIEIVWSMRQKHFF